MSFTVRPKRILLHLFLLLVLAGMIFPLVWMIIISLRTGVSDFSSLGGLFEGRFTIDNYSDVFTSGSFGRYFLNSFLVAGLTTVGNMLFCTMTGYALARRRIPFKGFWFITVIATLMIPQQVTMIPLYRLMVQFGWLNTYWALIVPSLVTPFGVFLMRQYIQNLPAEIEDAARMDGAGDWGILFRVVMPLCKPMLAVLGVFLFLTSWNNFLYPFLFTKDQSMYTLSVGLTFYLGHQSVDWGHLMAGASISALPVILLFLLFQRQIIQGMTAGAVKG